MAPIQFKLTKPNGLTRRIVFASQPDWLALGSKISSLYEIPFDKIGVSYVDTDGDEVTLSSDEELQDFYQVSYQADQAVKFGVQDLRSLRETQEQKPKSPMGSPTLGDRNTFGGNENIPLVFGVEDDWQRIGGLGSLGGMFVPRSSSQFSDSAHGFVESVQSESAEKDTVTGSVDDSVSQPDLHFQEKGKSKAFEDVYLAPDPVIVEDTAVQSPVHLHDVGNQHSEAADSQTSHPNISEPIPPPNADAPYAESTPKAGVDASLPDVEVPTDNVTETAPDPPLPTLVPPSISVGASSASLSDDVATLLNTFMNVFSSHPELSEGVRNIVKNATNGTYWSTHREAVSRAAEEFRRTAQEEAGLATEEAAGRRVAEALGGLFQAFRDVTADAAVSVGANDEGEAPAAPTSGDAGVDSTNTAPAAHLPNNDEGDFLGPPSWSASNYFRGPPPPPPPPHSFGHWGQPFRRRHDHWRSMWGPPPRGEPTWSHLPPGAHPSAGPPPPPGPPPRPPPPPGHVPPPILPHWAGTSRDSALPPPTPGAWSEYWTGPASNASPLELRAQVEAAKVKYKAEKEKYRREREDRRKRQHNMSNETDNDALPKEIDASVTLQPHAREEPVSHLVSNARGSFPQLEMVSVPRRHHTYSGPHRPFHGFSSDRASQRVSRRLADMGFTELAYPTLPAKVKEQIPQNGNLTKDAEDDIVTTLLEDLLSMSPKPPAASGSGPSKDINVPGAWN